MLFFSFFKTLVGKEVAVEMKNDIVITGIDMILIDDYDINNYNRDTSICRSIFKCKVD